jgi:hypothetical protein
MYMCDLRHIHDSVLSSLKMEGIRFFTSVFEFFVVLKCNPYRKYSAVPKFWAQLN